MSVSELQYSIAMKWHFFARSHGKGAVGGIGGQVKHAVWNAVNARQTFSN